VRKGLAAGLLLALGGVTLIVGCGSPQGNKSLVTGIAPAKQSVRGSFEAAGRAVDDFSAHMSGVRERRAIGGRVGTALDELVGPVSLFDIALAGRLATDRQALLELIDQSAPDQNELLSAMAVLKRDLHQVSQSVLVANPAKFLLLEGPHLTITVTASEYRFEPSVIEVVKGTNLTIRLVNRGKENHEWEADGLELEIKPISPGSSAQLTFVANRSGEFAFVCHVVGHTEKGMRGRLIVK
jgi:plastocyanin